MAYFSRLEEALKAQEREKAAIQERQRQQWKEELQVSPIKLERLGGQVETAQRQQLARDLMTQQQAAQRQLAAQQARSGMRGGAAAAQQARIQQQVEQQRRVGEEQGLTQRTLYNLEQAQKEQFANIAQNVAMKQILASLTGQQLAAEAAKEGAKAQAQVASQGGGGCCVVLCIVKASLGLNPVEAKELIELSKVDMNQVHLNYGCNMKVMNAIDQLNEARFIRDHYITKKELRGYYKLSEMIVPRLEKQPWVIKLFGEKVILKPILDIPNNTYLSRVYRKVWNFFGSDQPFVRKNGELV